MTIAITPFDGLCGFRPLTEIAHFLSTVPSLRKLVGESAAKEFESAISGHETSGAPEDTQENKKALQAAFSALMKNEKSTVASAAKDLVASAKQEGETFAGGGGPANEGKELADLVVRLNGQFEGDIGLFVLFFLNYVKLEVGEAMFLKADDIHAYLSGGECKLLNPHISHPILRPYLFPLWQRIFFELFPFFLHHYLSIICFCLAYSSSLFFSYPLLFPGLITRPDIIECMASSDNVVRAGFTPKYQDIPTLTNMLTYSYAPISSQKMSPVSYPYCTLNSPAYSSSSSSILYDPPIEEFSVVKTELKAKGAKATFEAIDGPSIVICTRGKGKIGVGPKTEEVGEGHVFFVGATAELVLEGEGEEFVTFKAFCELGKDSKESATGGN